MLDIKWSNPYPVKQGIHTKWKREWCITKEMLSGFFDFWKRNKFKLLAEGFSVYKGVTGKWYFSETKDNIALFKIFGDILPSTKNKKIETPKIVLPTYNIKNKDGLRDWQLESVEKLVSSINYWEAAIDGSDMGTGKTFSAIGVIRELNVPFVVICPKAIREPWRRVIKNHFKLEDKLIEIVNYERLIRGKKDSKVFSYVLDRKTRRKKIEWKLPKNTLIIYDEAHKLKNWKTKNSKICMQAYKNGYKMLFLSATIATNPLEMRTIGTCLKMFKNSKEYYEWVYNNGCYKGTWGLCFNNDKNVLKELHKVLFQERGIRLRRDSIPNFPEIEIIAESYNMDDEEVSKINSIYKEMKGELKKLELIKKYDKENEMTIRIRARQKVELLKVPLFIDMALEEIENGMSVAIFVNYSDTIDALSERLKTKCIFDGRIPDKIRQANVDKFQQNKESLILINSSAGGAGLSLGDEDGEHPRESLVSPDDDAQKIKQVTGRTCRENSKSKSIVKIITVSNTVEEKVSENVRNKMDNMDTLNDGDLKI